VSVLMTDKNIDRPSDGDITERFPMTTVMSGFALWHKWQRDERDFTTTEAGELTGEILWQMLVSWANEIAATVERREVISEFISDIYSMAVLEVDSDEKGMIREAMDEVFKKKEE